MKSMKRNVFGIIFSFVMMLMMMPALGLSQTAYAIPGPTTYPIWIGGTQVTADKLAGEGWRYTPAEGGSSAILSLTGYNNNGEVGDKLAGIYAEEDLVIETSGTNTVSNPSATSANRAIYVGGDLTLKGNGTLNAVGGNRTIMVNNITVESGTVNVSDGQYGITVGSELGQGDIVIKNGTVSALGGQVGIKANNKFTVEKGTVIAESSGEGTAINTFGDVTIEGGIVEASGIAGIGSVNNVIINAGTVKVSSTMAGIYGHTGVTINNGTVKITAGGVDREGSVGLVSFKGDVVINNGSVEATANGEGSVGLAAYTGDAIINGGKLTASGKGTAIYANSVKNAINGTAWTDPAGTEGETAIEINKDGQDLTDYKKVQFPAKADPKPEPPKPTPTPSKASGALLGKMTAGKKSLKITWNKINGADGYDIFFARCNNQGKKITCKNVKSIKGNQTFKWTKSGLRKGTPYKAYVKAYTIKNGKKTYIKKSPTMHAYTGNGNNKYTNAKSVTVKKAKVSLKKGKTYKIKAKVNKVKKNKKLISNKHVAKLRYLTSNAKVATVSKSGKITAKGQGQCTITVLAHNGVSKNVKVTVK